MPLKAQVDPESVPSLTAEPAQHVQWASKVVGFSSQAGEKVFAAREALGKPNKLPSSGISGVAWMPALYPRLPEQWIKVGFDQPMPAQQVLIGESARPGALDKIYLFDRNHRPVLVWERDSSTQYQLPDVGESRIFSAEFERTEFDVTAAMVVLTSPDSLSVHQIDAIGIADHRGNVQASINLGASATWEVESENLGVEINSFFDEVFPVISPDGKTLFFDRKNHPANIGEGNNDDIWIARRDSLGLPWGKVKNAGYQLNNPEHNFVCSITPDGNTVLLGNVYHKDGSMSQGISIAHRTENGWTFPEAIEIVDYYNDSDFGEFQLTANGKVILMAIEREDSRGKRDLYASFSMKTGGWSPPVHLGDDLNTAALEMSPFLASDMKTLYFSSSGFSGYGGNDMFVSRRLDDSWTRWTEPQNLGPALNSAKDDAYYSVPAIGNEAYFASNNQSIGRSDLFRIELPEDLQPEPVVLIAGSVVNARTGEPLQARITYETDRGSIREEAGVARSGGSKGNYQIVLPYGEQYAFRAEAEGYFALEERIDLLSTEEYVEITRDLELIPLEVGEIIPLEHIQFEANRARLLDTSFVELNRAAEFLMRYPALSVEIGGHTNDRCSESFCRELSQRRARRVYEYLIQRGVAMERVAWRGYGSAEPVADNETAEGRALNQRVELKITAVQSLEKNEGKSKEKDRD